jgi:hypothetical protein
MSPPALLLAPPVGNFVNFFKGSKVPFFVMKSALFVQANVAVNTILTSKVARFVS